MLIDLRQRAVALAGVVAGVGRPRSAERLEQLARDRARWPCAGEHERRRAASGEPMTTHRLQRHFRRHQVRRHVVHVLVGELRQQRLVPGQRIAESRPSACRRCGGTCAGCRRPAAERDEEVVDAHERGPRPSRRTGSVTVAVTALRGSRPGPAWAPRPPRGRHRPPRPETHRFCSALGSGTACRCPADRRSASGTGCTSRRSRLLAGGRVADDDVRRRRRLPRAARPGRRLVASTLWMYSAIALTSSVRQRAAAACLARRARRCTIGSISSPCLIVQHHLRSQQIRTAELPPRRSAPWQALQVVAYSPLPALDQRRIAGGRCCAGKVPGWVPRPP